MNKKRNARPFNRYHAPKYRRNGGHQQKPWLPTVAEIAERSLEVQATWSDRERLIRTVQVSPQVSVCLEPEGWRRRDLGRQADCETI